MVDVSQGTTPEVVLWSQQAHTCAHIQLHAHTCTHEHKDSGSLSAAPLDLICLTSFHLGSKGLVWGSL